MCQRRMQISFQSNAILRRKNLFSFGKLPVRVVERWLRPNIELRILYQRENMQ